MNRSERFLADGYIIQKVEDQAALTEISRQVLQITQEHLSCSGSPDPQKYFDTIAERIEVDDLNRLRLAIIHGLMKNDDFHQNYFRCARSLIEELVGNEIAMQKNMGFNIQLPGDDSSLLAPHSDVWGSECSPFEGVMWLPLVDCARTKSLFILPPDKDRYWRNKLAGYNSMDECYDKIKNDVIWVTIQYGEVLFFSPTLLHGNRINLEEGSRWSFNIRFKGLFTPYAGKGFGEYFQPLQIRPLTRIGMNFEYPRVEDDG